MELFQIVRHGLSSWSGAGAQIAGRECEGHQDPGRAEWEGGAGWRIGVSLTPVLWQCRVGLLWLAPPRAVFGGT
jgi:hypothetical protein